MTTLLIKIAKFSLKSKSGKQVENIFAGKFSRTFSYRKCHCQKKTHVRNTGPPPNLPARRSGFTMPPYPASLRSSPTAHANRFHSKNHRNSSASTILRGLLRTSRLATTPPPVWPNFTPSPTRNSYFFRGIKSATGCASRKTTFHANLTAFRITFEGGIRFTGATFSPNF